jgi:hypothetical protein
MTVLEDRITAVAAPRSAPRRARPAPSSDLHARLLAAANRLLDAPSSTVETTFEDTLGQLVGGLINMVPSGGKSPSKHDVVELVERIANRLGCPPEPAPVWATDALVVERWPGGKLVVTGLLANPDVVEAIAEAATQAADDGVDLLRLFAEISEFGQSRLDMPVGSLEDQAYGAAFSEVTALIGSTPARFAPRDLVPIAEAVEAENDRGLVSA